MRLPAASSPSPSVRRFLEYLLLAALPALILGGVMVEAYRRGILGYDFEQFMLPAARNVAAGGSPYPAYEYPPLVAFALVPFTVVPGPNIVFAAILIACMPASLWFLGVRDWRCYGVVFLWAPVLAGVQTSNVTIPLLLGSAICWHARDRWKTAAVAGGLAVAAKLLPAPLVVWLAGDAAVRGRGRCRRRGGGRVARPVGGDRFLRGRRLSGQTSARSPAARLHQSYTLKVVLEDMGLGRRPGSAGWAIAACGRRGQLRSSAGEGDDRRSFALAVTAMIVAVPVVWLHSFALLIAPVAVMRPRLSAAWIVPILMIIGPGTGNGDPWQTAGMLVLMAVTLGLALFRPVAERRAVLPAADRFPAGSS